MGAPSDSIPLLDLSTARGQDGTFDPAFIDACATRSHRVGFFQLTGYGADAAEVDELFDVTRRFFELPLESRLELDNRLSPHFRGYTRLGPRNHQGRPDAREQLDFGPERPAVEHYPPDQPYWLVQGPNLMPDRALPELRTVCMAWAERMSRVGAELLGAIAVSLELPEGLLRRTVPGLTGLDGQVRPLRRRRRRRCRSAGRRRARGLRLRHLVAPGPGRRPAGAPAGQRQLDSGGADSGGPGGQSGRNARSRDPGLPGGHHPPRRGAPGRRRPLHGPLLLLAPARRRH